MASQPANSLINIRYMVRSYRQDLRHEAVLALLGFPGMRGAVMSIPGGVKTNGGTFAAGTKQKSEVLVSETRDTDDDAIVTTSLLGERLDGEDSGLPVVRFLKPVVTLGAAVAGIPHLAMPLRLGRDVFLFKTDAFNTDDIQQDLRNV
jgi:hypothetical protein